MRRAFLDLSRVRRAKTKGQKMKTMFEKWAEKCNTYARKCKFWLGMSFGWCFGHYCEILGGDGVWAIGFIIVFVICAVRTIQYGRAVDGGKNL